MIVRAERMVGHRIVVVVPAISQLSIESRHRLVGPRPVTQQTSEAVDRRVAQRLFERRAGSSLCLMSPVPILLLLEYGLAQPFLEADLTEPRVTGRNQ